MTGLTTGATNACYVTAIDKAGNESERHAINIPTKLYTWEKYGYIETPKATDGTASRLEYVVCPTRTYFATISSNGPYYGGGGADSLNYQGYSGTLILLGDAQALLKLKNDTSSRWGCGGLYLYGRPDLIVGVARLEMYMGYNQLGERCLWTG